MWIKATPRCTVFRCRAAGRRSSSAPGRAAGHRAASCMPATDGWGNVAVMPDQSSAAREHAILSADHRRRSPRSPRSRLASPPTSTSRSRCAAMTASRSMRTSRKTSQLVAELQATALARGGGPARARARRRGDLGGPPAGARDRRTRSRAVAQRGRGPPRGRPARGRSRSRRRRTSALSTTSTSTTDRIWAERQRIVERRARPCAAADDARRCCAASGSRRPTSRQRDAVATVEPLRSGAPTRRWAPSRSPRMPSGQSRPEMRGPDDAAVAPGTPEPDAVAVRCDHRSDARRHAARDRLLAGWRRADRSRAVDRDCPTLLEALGDDYEPRALLLTHIHLDHAGASGRWSRRWPALEVYVHERGAPHMVDPIAAARERHAAVRRRHGAAVGGVACPSPRSGCACCSGGRR